MTRTLTIIAVTMGVVFFLYGVISGQPLLANIVFMLGIIVANVPEGLLPTLTLALSMASLRMARKTLSGQSLEAVESLVYDAIRTDKQERHEERIGIDVDRCLRLNGDELQPHNDRRLLRLALIASDLHGRDGHWTGDPLDVEVAERFTSLGGQAAPTVEHTMRHFPFDVRKRGQAGLLADGDDAVFATSAWESLRPLIRFIVSTNDHVDSIPPTRLG